MATQRQREEAEALKRAHFARNEELLTEFIARMRGMDAPLTTIEVHDVRTTKKQVKTGWFSNEVRETVETIRVGSLSFWPGAVEMTRVFVCPDRLVFWAHGDSYMDYYPGIPTSMSSEALAKHRDQRDFLFGVKKPSEFAASLAETYRAARK